MTPPTTTTTLSYHHLAVVCSNVAISQAFYEQVGFIQTKQSGTATVMQNDGGLELHLFPTCRPHPNNVNILMDMDEIKYPGHSHMSFGVKSVSGVEQYFKSIGVPLSGTRKFPNVHNHVAVFVRDPDRTVLEFERNDGGDDTLEVTKATLSQAPRGGIDHIGTRIANPYQALEWYTKLGFTRKVMMYEPDLVNPLKNFRPWIIRTQHGSGEEVDINLILNATIGQCNMLIGKQEDPLPGILYACYVVKDLEATLSSLEPTQVARTLEDLEAWGISSMYVLEVGKTSCFVRDLDHNLFRLIEQ